MINVFRAALAFLFICFLGWFYFWIDDDETFTANAGAASALVIFIALNAGWIVYIGLE